MSEFVDGKIVGYNEKTGTLSIIAKYPDAVTLLRRGYERCRIELLDDRSISPKQRNFIYKLFRAVSEHTGMSVDDVKDALKLTYREANFIEEDFSLGDMPMSQAYEFQKFLVRWVIDNDIPCEWRLLDYVDDVEDYVYACLRAKKCCICGKHTDLHHTQRVGMGRDRNEINHIGMRALPLCRVHHEEAHLIGEETFEQRYHLPNGIPIDETICRIYGLKGEADA